MIRSIGELTKKEDALEKEIAQIKLKGFVAKDTGDNAGQQEFEIEIKEKNKLLERNTNELGASRVLLDEWVSGYIRDPERPKKPGLFASDAQLLKWRQDMDAWNSVNDQKQASKTDLAFQQAQGFLQNMAGYFLPLLYGLLGAFTYVLRALSREISGISFSRGSHIQFMLRLLLGLLAGISVGWFLRTESSEIALLDISPFAMAFLAGYSVELVFTAMDKIVDTFSSTGSPSKPV